MSDEDQLREARLRREVDRLDSVGQALFESFRGLGMDDEAALVATRGRDGSSDGTRSLDESSSQRGGGSQFDALVDTFARFGLSEAGAEQAAAGHQQTPAGARLAESRAASPAGGQGRSRSRPDSEWSLIHEAAATVGARDRRLDPFNDPSVREFAQAVSRAQDQGLGLREAIGQVQRAHHRQAQPSSAPRRASSPAPERPVAGSERPLVENFQSLGLSESGARAAAAGRDAPRGEPVRLREVHGDREAAFTDEQWQAIRQATARLGGSDEEDASDWRDLGEMVWQRMTTNDDDAFRSALQAVEELVRQVRSITGGDNQ